MPSSALAPLTLMAFGMYEHLLPYICNVLLARERERERERGLVRNRPLFEDLALGSLNYSTLKIDTSM